jgi:hypothetical protein
MGFSDFAPSSRGRAKPITKAAMRRMAEKFAHADEISKELRAKEEEEKKKAVEEFDGLLNDF